MVGFMGSLPEGWSEVKMSLPPKEFITRVIVNLLGDIQSRNLKKVF